MAGFISSQSAALIAFVLFGGALAPMAFAFFGSAAGPLWLARRGL